MTDTSYSAYGSDLPEAIEREVDAERSRVAETLDALQDKMSVGSIVDDVVRSFSRYGGDMAGNLGRQVRQNPLPLLLTGVGLVWLMTSSGRDRSRRRHDEDYLWEADDEVYEEEFVGTRRYGTVGAARPYGTAGVSGTYRGDGSSTTDSIRGAAGSAASGASSAARGAGHAAGSAASSVSDAAGSAAHGAAHAAGSAASGVSGAVGSAARGVSRAVGAVASGLGNAADGAASALSSGGRGAYRGGRHAGQSVRDGAYRGYDMGRSSLNRLDELVEDHPLVMGAVALTVGAAIGSALPRTRTEDEYLGEYSEHAWESARDTVQREAEKARRVAGAVADEAREIYNEKSEEVQERMKEAADQGRSAADRAKSEATEAAARLRDTAKSEAEKQHLGDPKKPA